MATMGNPQQVAHAPCEDARIGRSAHGIESYRTFSKTKCGKSPSHRKARTSQRAGTLSITGGCLNPSAEVLLTERETQPGLPLINKGRGDRTAASDLTGLAPRSHSTLNVG